MTFDLIIRPEAEAEITEAFVWYEERVTGLGSDFLLNVDASLQAIRRNPYHFPLVYKKLRRALVRRFPYQIIFILEENRIVVLAVFHGKRNPKSWHDQSN